MAEIDSLSISIKSSADAANKAIDSVIDRLGKLSDKVKSSLGNIPNIGKNINFDNVTNGVKSMQSHMQSAGKSMEQSLKKVSDMTADFENKWKDFGKGFQFFGNEKKLDGEIVKTSNLLEKSKLKQEELFTAGKTDTAEYENAIKDVQKYTNILDSLKAKQAELSAQQTTQIFDDEAFNNLPSIKAQTEQFQQSVTESFERVAESAREFTGAWDGIKIPQELLDNVEEAEKTVREKIESIQEIFKDSGKDFTFEGNSEQLEKEMQKVNSELEGLYNKQDRMIELGKIDTSQFKEVIRDIENSVNRLEILENYRPEALNRTLEENTQKVREAAERWNEFKQVMNNLPTPKINESNLEKLNSALRKSENNVDDLVAKLNRKIATGEIKANVDDSGFRRLIEQITLAEKETEALRARIAEISRQQLNLDNSSVNIFTAALSKLGTVAKTLKSGLSGIASVLSQFGSAVKSALVKLNSFAKSLLGLNKSSKGLHGSLGGGIKTILKYSLGIRSLYMLVNKLRSAIKEGIKNLVQYSDEVNASVSLLRNSLNQTKNALAAGLAPALNALAPIINNIIQGFIRAVNVINQLSSALLGKSTWIRAKQLTDSYRDSLTKAGKAAKNSIRPFDELNTIMTQDSGGASDETPAEDMFETVDIDTDISDFADKLKRMWESADFTDLGRNIGEKIKNSLDGISWDTVFDGARKFGQSLATFLNGLISFELFGSVGRTIANGLNTAIYSALSFAENFDFVNFGLSIAEGINNFFETFDFTSLAQTLNKWVDGIKETIKTAIANIEWGDIWEKLKEFVLELDIDTTAVLAVFAAPAVISGVTKLIEMLTNLWRIITGIGKVIVVIIKSIQLISGISAIIGGAILAVTNFVTMLKDGFSWINEILMVIGIALTAVGAVILGVSAPIAAVVAAVVAAVGTIAVVVKEHWEEIAGFFSNLRDSIISIWKTVSGWFNENVVVPLANLFNNVLYPIFTSFFDGISDIVKGIKEIFSGLISFVTGVFTADWSKAWEGIKKIFFGIWDALSAVLKTPLNAVLDLLEGLANGIIDGWNYIKKAINSLSFTIPDWVPVIGGEKLGFDMAMTQHVNIPRFATGGFPEDGLFYANHTELVGQFSNGQTAVANNEQIIAGIRQAAYEGFKMAMSESNRYTNNEPIIKVYVGDRELTDIVIDGINQKASRYGHMPFDMRYR